MNYKHLIIACAILALAGCGRGKQAPGRIPQASDSLYTSQAAMKIYGTQPERALAIIDSALLVGNVNPFKADFFREQFKRQYGITPTEYRQNL